MQKKVEEAEKKQKQIQEQLEGITQQLQELQPKCAELKAEVQRQNTPLKTSEVRVHTMHQSGCKADSTVNVTFKWAPEVILASKL